MRVHCGGVHQLLEMQTAVYGEDKLNGCSLAVFIISVRRCIGRAEFVEV